MRISRILPLLALLAACSDDATGPAAGVRLSAMVNGSPPPGGGNVTITVENRGSRPVLLPRCGDHVMVAVERRVGGEWESYSEGVCPFDLVSVPLELAPGATAASAHQIRDSGRFRARLDVSHADEPETVQSVRTSGFDIR
jgi:hypothetical protein